MQMTIDSGKLGFLAIAVSPTVYANLSATPFIKPANPSPAPAILTNTTIINQTAIRYRLALETDLYTILHNMDKAPNQHLLGVVEDIYARSLKDNYVGYGNLICLDMIDYLKANYYKITLACLKHNSAQMNAPHNINDPFESVIEKIETAVYFSDNGKVPYTPEQVVTTAYNQIFATGYFVDACLRWNRNPATSKTWAEFNIYIVEEH